MENVRCGVECLWLSIRFVGGSPPWLGEWLAPYQWMLRLTMRAHRCTCLYVSVAAPELVMARVAKLLHCPGFPPVVPATGTLQHCMLTS